MFTTMTTSPAGPHHPHANPQATGHASGPLPGAEQTLLLLRTHPKILFRPFVAQVVLLAAHIAMVKWFPGSTGIEVVDQYATLVVHGLLLAGEAWFSILPVLRWHHARFEVTDRRIRQRWGVLHKHSREINLDRITQVGGERGILDRIFRCGTIIIYDAANASAIRFHDVPRFHRVRETIDDARHAAHLRAVGQMPAAQPGSQW